MNKGNKKFLRIWLILGIVILFCGTVIFMMSCGGNKSNPIQPTTTEEPFIEEGELVEPAEESEALKEEVPSEGEQQEWVLDQEQLETLSGYMEIPLGLSCDQTCGGVPPCGGKCGFNNPYPCCDNGGNCTYWAWHQACNNWFSNGMTENGNANTWADRARQKGFPVKPDPSPGTIGVNINGTYGHVAWVEKVEGDYVTVSEMNCCSNCSNCNNAYCISCTNCTYCGDSYCKSGFREKKYLKTFFNGGYIYEPLKASPATVTFIWKDNTSTSKQSTITLQHDPMGQRKIVWYETVGSSWLSILPTTGTFNIGEKKEIVVKLVRNSVRNMTPKPPGEYYDGNIYFKYKIDGITLSNGTEIKAREHVKVKLAIDPLKISPKDVSYSSSKCGLIGKEIIYTLDNTTGPSKINWTAKVDKNWITISPASGPIPKGSSITVKASINNNVTSLTSGEHTATITFTNTTYNLGSIKRKIVINCDDKSLIANIIEPKNCRRHKEGDPLDFKGEIINLRDGNIKEVKWTSNLYPYELGSTLEFSRTDLEAGKHNITLTATDNCGATSSMTIGVNVCLVWTPDPSVICPEYCYSSSKVKDEIILKQSYSLREEKHRNVTNCRWKKN
jgi:surface antigen